MVLYKFFRLRYHFYMIRNLRRTQYKKKGSERGIGYGYASKMENYYETYIYSVVGNKDSIIFGKFSDIFTDKNYKPYLDEIIDLDLYFFGLIYFTAFEKRVLDTSRKDAFEKELKNAINDIKGNGLHTKSPACLKYLRERIFKSIEIYQKYLN